MFTGCWKVHWHWGRQGGAWLGSGQDQQQDGEGADCGRNSEEVR